MICARWIATSQGDVVILRAEHSGCHLQCADDNDTSHLVGDGGGGWWKLLANTRYTHPSLLSYHYASHINFLLWRRKHSSDAILAEYSSCLVVYVLGHVDSCESVEGPLGQRGRAMHSAFTMVVSSRDIARRSPSPRRRTNMALPGAASPTASANEWSRRKDYRYDAQASASPPASRRSPQKARCVLAIPRVRSE
eukprot:COSAG05_NODE_1202_length_5536_cov_1.814420_3_plen_195_part_00